MNTANMKMKPILIWITFLLVGENICSPSRRFDELAFQKYLTKAKDVLDRVPLIDT